MQQIERTTPPPTPREPANSPAPENAQDTDIETRVTVTKQTREVHIYTYPGPDTHYENSAVSEHIAKNPALYWGNAKF